MKLKFYRGGQTGNVTVEIKATDGLGKPTGAVLASGTTDGNTLPTVEANAEWREISLGSGTPVTQGTKYAVIVYCESAGAEGSWMADDSAPEYGGGSYGYSSDSGASWAMITSADLMFETYNILYTISASASANGTISPSGVSEIEPGGSLALVITPNANCHLVDVLVDSVSVGTVTAYSFANVQVDHTIEALFAERGSLPRGVMDSIRDRFQIQPGGSLLQGRRGIEGRDLSWSKPGDDLDYKRWRV